MEEKEEAGGRVRGRLLQRTVFTCTDVLLTMSAYLCH